MRAMRATDGYEGGYEGYKGYHDQGYQGYEGWMVTPTSARASLCCIKPLKPPLVRAMLSTIKR